METVLLRNSTMTSTESASHGLNFQPLSDDIFITTYPKSGTTLVSQICHCIRSLGDMSFEEIFEVVPWTICAGDCGVDLNSDQKGFHPRLFKSHEDYFKVPKGGKYILVVREPVAVLKSFHYFLLAWTAVPIADVSIEEFASTIFAKSGSDSGLYWNYLMSWWPHRHDSNVLWLFYEDIVADRRSAIRKIAAHMNIDVSRTLPSIPAILSSSHQLPCITGTSITLEDVVFAMSDAAFMKQFETKFDEHIVWRNCRYRMGIDWSLCPFETPPTLTKVKQLLKKEKTTTATAGDSVKVSTDGEKSSGSSSSSSNSYSEHNSGELPDSVSAMLQSKWQQIILPHTGFSTYAEMRAAFS